MKNVLKTSVKEISDFVDREYEDCGYGPDVPPESYEVKGMIADFVEMKLGIIVESEED